MSQYPNLNELSLQSEAEKILYGFYTLDQKKLLISQLGLSEPSFNKLLAIYGQNNYWTDIIAPGKKRGTLLDKLIDVDYSGINFNSQQFNRELFSYPFAFLKEGETFDPDDPDLFEASRTVGTTFNKMVLDYPFAAFADFSRTDFISTQIQHYYFHKAYCNNISITDCKFIDGEFNDRRFVAGSDFDNYGEMRVCFIQNSMFKLISAYNVYWWFCTITDSKFYYFDLQCTLDKDRIFENNLQNNVFYSGYMNVFYSQNGYSITNNTFDYVIFSEMDNGRNNKIDTLCEGNVFKNCFFYDLELGGTFINNKLNTSYFSNIPTIQNDVDVSGTSFEGTNLDDYFTKAAFKAAVGNYNERTLWVDGTPL